MQLKCILINFDNILPKELPNAIFIDKVEVKSP